jgi:hypothetical protein
MADEKTVPDDNTDPDVPFDGAHPDNIPPADSNEQLALAHEKREAAFRATAAKRRKAASSDKPEARTSAPEGRSGRPTAKA